eukprot:190181_1
MSSFLLTTTIINIISLSFAVDWPVYPFPSIQYGFKTAPNGGVSTVTSGSTSVHTLTLYWNGYTFQCEIIPQNANSYYLCDSSTSTLCTISSNITYGLQIDNTGSDESIITEIIIKEMLQIQILNTIIINQFCFNQTNFGWKQIDSNNTCISASNGGYYAFLFGHRNDNQHVFFHLSPSTNTNEIYPMFKTQSAVCNRTETIASNCTIYDQTYKPSNPNIDYNKVIKAEVSVFVPNENITETKNCTANSNVCHIQCLVANSCQQLPINMNVSELIIDCKANLACADAVINVSNSNITSLQIHCYGIYSCENVLIIMNDVTA